MAALSRSVINDDRFEQAFAPTSPVTEQRLAAPPVAGFVAAAVLVGWFGLWVSGAGDEPTRFHTFDAMSIGAALLAVVAAAVVRTQWAAAAETRRAWTLLGVAMAGVAAASVVDVVGGHDHVPSVGDAVRLAFYPLAAGALVGLVRTPAVRRTLVLDGLVVAISATALVWYAGLAHVADGADDRWSVVVATATIGGDLVVVFGAVALLLRRPDDVAERSLQLLLAAIVVHAVADVVYAVQLLDGSFSSSSWSLPLWVLGWMLVAGAADTQRRAAKRRIFDAYSGADGPSLVVSRLPYIAVVGAGLLLVRIAFDLGISAEGGALIGAVALVAIVLVRQGLTVGDANALLEQYRDVLDTDRLTGLPNRRRFLDEAEQTIHMTQLCGLPVGLVVLDVDGLKHHNDALGEPAGDAILREVANRVRMALRGRDLVARYGADEIVALLPGTDDAGTDFVANRLRRELAAPVLVDGRQVEVSVSIGMAGSGLATTTTAELLIAGDESLERAKRLAKVASAVQRRRSPLRALEQVP